MRERAPLDPFEQRLAHLVRAYTEPAAAPVDPLLTARLAMRPPVGGRARITLDWRPGLDRRVLLLLVAAATLAVLGAVALAGGSKPPAYDGPPRLLFIRDGDINVSAIDGTGASVIRDGGADGGRLGYLTALWSPDMRHIAAVRDTAGSALVPAVDILAPDGDLERTVELGPGGTPSISWSPDAQHLAITTYPVDGAMTLPPGPAVLSRVGLRISDLDGGIREIGLPDGVRLPATARPETWQVDPDFGVKWSPDGRWIAVAWDRVAGLWHLVASDGSSIRELADVSDGRCSDPPNQIDWFPDGHRLAVQGGDVVGNDRLCVEGIDTGAGDEPGRLAEIPEDPTSDLHGKLGLPSVSPDGMRIASGDFMSDFRAKRHVTTLRVYDAASGDATDVATGVQELIVDPSGPAESGATLGGTPVWAAGVTWTPDARGLLFLSPQPGGSTGSWTISTVDAEGAGSPSVVATGVRSFDLGYVH